MPWQMPCAGVLGSVVTRWGRLKAASQEEAMMSGTTIKIRATEGGEFDCYMATAVVLACAIHGVDADIRQIADEFAAAGFIAAAPDLFWRTVPGPLGHDDKRAQERSQPRREKIETNERDLVDT